MPKRNAQPYSPFDALKTVKQSSVQTSKHLDSHSAVAIVGSDTAKSKNPSFTKFTIYIQKSTHRAAKLKALEHDRELSELVEQLLTDWLKKQ